MIRYVVSEVFKRLTVHRGMYHSIPAMLVAGLCVYLAYHSPDRNIRVLLGCGVMLGFLSHLVLDEIYSVDWRGMKPKLKSSAGSAVKFFSPSLFANVTCYTMLGGLLYLACTWTIRRAEATWVFERYCVNPPQPLPAGRG